MKRWEEEKDDRGEEDGGNWEGRGRMQKLECAKVAKRKMCVWDAKLSLSLSLTLTLSFPWKQGAHDFLRCRAAGLVDFFFVGSEDRSADFPILFYL